MSRSRISEAVATGALTLPDGPVLVLRPGGDIDLSALPKDRTHISQSFYPDHAAWAARDYRMDLPEAPVGAAIVCVPRSKALARALIAEAVARAELVVVDGQKTDGIDSIFKAIKPALDAPASLSMSHGRLFWFPVTDRVRELVVDWTAPAPERAADGFLRQVGVFSEAGADEGSRLLAEALPVKLPAHVVDLGAGWGYLSVAILAREGVKHLDLVEAEALSLECARQNVNDPRAVFHWADATDFKPQSAPGGVVMNPPFHVGRKGDPSVGQAFIGAAARMLAPGGHLWMVANRHLPYETALGELFRDVREIGGTSAFKVIHATKLSRGRG
ncbi:MAG: class I SAM-dependent methyltransferase [Marivita sp.]|uniref:class I SAM-dependent methyltransferase n=1 Tax=Marivita sp. TaxID=2003365 RepID=UPI003EF4581D